MPGLGPASLVAFAARAPGRLGDPPLQPSLWLCEPLTPHIPLLSPNQPAPPPPCALSLSVTSSHPPVGKDHHGAPKSQGRLLDSHRMPDICRFPGLLPGPLDSTRSLSPRVPTGGDLLP